MLMFVGSTYAFSTPPASSIVINEVNYRSPVMNQNIDFIEIHNTSAVIVNLSDWTFSSGIKFKFPANTLIAGGGYRVIAADPAEITAIFGTTGVLGPYVGNLASKGDKLILNDASFGEVDRVNYKSWGLWPGVRYMSDGDSSVSIQKLHPSLTGNNPGSWGSAVPTPGAVNADVIISNPAFQPILEQVKIAPAIPISGQPVLITGIFEAAPSGTTVTLEYQINLPGYYKRKKDLDANPGLWITAPMTDNGVGADFIANDRIYSAEIPTSVQAHRNFIRYRVKVTGSGGFNRTYPDLKHRESNLSYYVYDGHLDFEGYSFAGLNQLQEVVVLATQIEVDTFIGGTPGNLKQYKGKEYLGEGTLIYNGEIYDHIKFRPKGGDSRYKRPKPGIKFDMNREHTMTPIDDYGDQYEISRGKFTISGTWVNDPASHGLMESLSHKIQNLVGGLGKHADYTTLRIVDSPTEADAAGDFWGIYLILENYDGDMLEERGMQDGNIYGWKPNDIGHQGNYPGSDSLDPWSVIRIVPWYEFGEDGNRELIFADKVATEIYGNGDYNYYGKHSYREYYDPTTGLRHGWCGDFDDNFGMTNLEKVEYLRAYSNPGIVTRQPLQVADTFRIEYEGVMRSAYDLLLDTTQSNFLVDMESAKIYDGAASYNWTDLDQARWNQVYDLGDAGAQIAWYKTWFPARGQAMMNDTIDWGCYDTEIPNTPVITNTGGAALDQLTYSTSAYVGTHPFAAMQWRVGEWSDPTNPVYDFTSEPIYEIEDKWVSNMITTFTSTITIPSSAMLQAGHTYKVRVRYQDNTGRWSHWSEADQIIPTPPVNPNVIGLAINELMYAPITSCGTEYIELINKGTGTISLDDVYFSDGIEYKFPTGTLLPGQTELVLAKDSLEFLFKYGYSPFGSYTGSLENGGERLEIRGSYDVILDSMSYMRINPFDPAVTQGKSLELLHFMMDNSDALNWFRSDNICGTPGLPNSRTCYSTADNIVINEINYNSNNAFFDPGDWVELYNPSANSVDLSGWSFHDNSSDFVIPTGTVIQGEGYMILAEDAGSFSTLFPNVPIVEVSGDFIFGLSSSGERISLFDPGKCLADYVIYDDAAPWPLSPDGSGATLSLIAHTLDNALAASWEGSDQIGAPFGTPGLPNQEFVDFNVHVWLEGAFNAITGKMKTTLNTGYGMLPGQTPLNGATATPAGQPYNQAPWNYAGTEGVGWTDGDYQTKDVDWVMVSFRLNQSKNSEIARVAALVQEDGKIRFPNANFLNVGHLELYVAVQHRNHMIALSTHAIDISDGTFDYDFRAGNSLTLSGFGQTQLSNADWALYSADLNQNEPTYSDIDASDKAKFSLANGIFGSYRVEDMNMNGDITGADKLFFTRNNGIFSQIEK